MFSVRCHQIARSLINIQNNAALQAVPPGNASKHRAISTSKTLQDNYYESLGISRDSTQNDIKAAYYKLSMMYHPDKNQGCETSAKKFREITQAYEVLSNYRLRRLYDKGIVHTAGPQYAQAETMRSDLDDVEEDDPQTKFYKSRFRRSKVANPQGQTPIYDFDEWARAHYGKSFDRRKAAKERFDRKTAEHKDFEIASKNEKVIFGMVICSVVLYLIVYAEQSYDTPRNKQKRKED